MLKTEICAKDIPSIINEEQVNYNKDKIVFENQDIFLDNNNMFLFTKLNIIICLGRVVTGDKSVGCSIVFEHKSDVLRKDKKFSDPKLIIRESVYDTYKRWCSIKEIPFRPDRELVKVYSLEGR